MKVSIVASECSPYFKTGGLADVIGSLPQALAGLDCVVEVLLPLFPLQKQIALTYVKTLTVTTNWRTQSCDVFEYQNNGIRYLFVKNDAYFNRPSLYGHHDEAERFVFFTHAIIQYYLSNEDKPDIVHCHDWQAGLVPIYVSQHQELSSIKTVFTIHNLRYQGDFPYSIFSELLELPISMLPAVSMDGHISFLKTAIVTSDYLTTVSPTYAAEIQTPEGGFGLHELLSSRSSDLIGILNGLDQESYNSATDHTLVYPGDPTPAMKRINKRAVQAELSLPIDDTIPLFAFISRIVDDKGISILLHALDHIEYPYQLAILGTGETLLEQALLNKASDTIAVRIGFFADLSRRLYAGSDYLLMPSKKEPCGLNQWIAMRYGSVPIVRCVGGLKDSVDPYHPYLYTGNGLVFANEHPSELANSINTACSFFKTKEHLLQLQQNGLQTDSSWNRSAKSYCRLYKAMFTADKGENNEQINYAYS